MAFKTDRQFEIWTRLFLDLGDEHWLEVYNALDENGYCMHYNKPEFSSPLPKCV